MKIYGLMFISLCMLAGNVTGEYLGRILGIPGNVGGVGFAMLLLLFGVNYLKKKSLFTNQAEEGITFWSDMYIPIVIAMTAIQNVVAAVHAGLVPIMGGLTSVLLSYVLLIFFNKMAFNSAGSDGSEMGKELQTVDHGCH